MLQPTFNFKIKPDIQEANYGKFIISPLFQGYGHTIGNSLRRVLLTSLEGAAVSQIKIKGVKHQFSTIPGVSEDVVQIILRIKKIRLKLEGEKEVKLTLKARGRKEVKAGDIKAPPQVSIVNKDLKIATLNDKKTKLEIEMKVEKGLGYVLAEDKEAEEMGAIPIDSIFTPVVKANYKVEETRVGGMTNLDKLILEVWTDGTLDPYEAVKKAAKILADCFKQVYEPKPSVLKEEVSSLPEQGLRATIEELELPTRVTNALLKEGIKNIGQILSLSKKELYQIKNMGIKSISLLEEKLNQRGFKLK